MDVRIGIILASIRQGRRGERFCKWIHELARQREGAAFEVLDLREFPLPAYEFEQMPLALEKNHTHEVARRWSERIHALDGYIVVTPEYNHGYPGQLKNAIDLVFSGWWYKPIAFVSYGGVAGGARAVEQLRNVAVEVRMVPVRGEVNFSLIGLAADEAGQPTDPMYGKRGTAMLDQLLWWARATKHARASEAPPA
jgi:NAD(P)H-dependent FMN reductase